MEYGEGAMPSLQKMFEIFMQNSAFSCKTFTCFKTYPVNEEEQPPSSPTPSFESVTAKAHCRILNIC